MHNTYFKNFIATAVLVMTSFLLIGAAFALVSRNVFISETRDTMIGNAREISRTAVAYGREGDLRNLELRMTLTSISGSTGQHIFITDTDGRVVNCSDTNILCEHIGKKLDSSVTDALSDTESTTFYGMLGGFYSMEHYVVAMPLLSAESGVLGYIFVAKDTLSALNIWQTILPLFFLISLAVFVIALCFSYASSKRLAKPIKALAEAARRFGHGDLSVRVEYPGPDDELGDLTEAFNTMADSLEKSEEKRREFIANVSHELKTPMTTISGFADGILDGTIPPESQNRYLQTISSETKRLARLVRSMLELSRLQAEERDTLLRKSFDISEILRLTLITFADKIERQKLDVDFQVPEEPMIVLGDSDAITQVIYNLLDNAIKFATEGTPIGVSLWKDSAKAYVSVRNQGATIPESEIPLLFDRFHKSDRSRSRNKDGVGLGLYIVKTILNNHGEDIAVTSRQGVTDFVFTLRLKQ